MSIILDGPDFIHTSDISDPAVGSLVPLTWRLKICLHSVIDWLGNFKSIDSFHSSHIVRRVANVFGLSVVADEPDE